MSIFSEIKTILSFAKKKPISLVVGLLLCIVLFVALALLRDVVFAINILFGIPVIFILPGYLVVTIFFNDYFEFFEKVLLSIVISIFISPLVVFVCFQLGIPFSTLFIYIEVILFNFLLVLVGVGRDWFLKSKNVHE